MCIGLTGIRFALESDWKSGSRMRISGCIFDLVDGLTARMLKATSKMGEELTAFQMQLALELPRL